MTASIDPFIRNLRARHELSRDEEQALLSMRWSLRRFERHDIIVRTGEELSSSMLLTSGFVVRSKVATDGSRQIVETNIAGDFIDLHGFVLRRLDHEISAVSPCEIAQVPHADIRRVTEAMPRLARALWFQTLVDAAVQREWMLVLGRKRSRARVAQFLCEMQVRLAVVGLADHLGFDLPFSQHELGDITGMTAVHLNRSLKELRDSALATYRRGHVDIHDLEGLRRAAQFDPGYLNLGRHEI